jgi:outer membrane protein assembly factor BamA
MSIRLFLICCIFLTNRALASYVIIDSITVEGNKRTRKALILRELQFKAGDSIAAEKLSETLEFNSNRLRSMGLFNVASINVKHWHPNNHVTLHIKVTETWYIFPVPLFELADRNFNVWWKEFNGSLKRVNYGLDLSHNNLTGNADVFKVKGQFGFNNRYEISYRFPPLDKEQRFRLRAAVSYSRSHEVFWNTLDGLLKFRRDDDVWQIQQFFSNVELNWRPRLFTAHNFTLEYRNNKASDSIAVILNPDYYLNARTRQRHASFVYTMDSDHRDLQPYPLAGYRWLMEFRANGLLPSDNLRLWRLYAEYSRFTALFDKKLSFETALKTRFSLPRKKPPYANNQALGYAGNYIRGYESFVADGLDFGILKTSIHLQLMNKEFNLGKWMPFKAFRIVPFKAFFAINNDFGYANDPWYSQGSTLSNTLLRGHGLGLDLILFYNKTLRFDYTWNHFGKGGLYIQINTGF